jgi:hypothetical protein
MSREQRVPIGDVLPGFIIHGLPEGWTPLEAIVLVKCLDDEGHSSWAFRTTPNLNDEELLGALIVRTDLLRKEVVEAYE